MGRRKGCHSGPFGNSSPALARIHKKNKARGLAAPLVLSQEENES